MLKPINKPVETPTPSQPAGELWAPPELQKLPVDETAATASNNGDDGVFFS
jgi:hypothetical protein